LLHEAGHLAAAFAVGFPEPKLHYSSISHGDITAHPGSSAGIVGLAGPLVTAALTLLGLSFATRQPSARWAFALSVAAASRFAVGVPYTVAALFVRFQGKRLQPPAFDEHKAALALGWSGDLVLGLTAAILVGLLIWLAFGLPGRERSAAWPGLLMGTAVGWAVWMGLLGPVVLA
jgi:hypothetical protein